jgi:hypothetical protein
MYSIRDCTPVESVQHVVAGKRRMSRRLESVTCPPPFASLPPRRFFRSSLAMVKIRTNRTKPPPEGFEDIESILEEYGRKMRDGQSPLPLPASCLAEGTPAHVAESESHEGKRKNESLWPIMRITHTRTRYIYDLYYKREAISTELYDWLCKQEYADAKYVALTCAHEGRRS